MPVNRKAHHTQFAAMPPSRTRFVTRFGVSVLKVVATMDTPISHHGAARPEVKNSAVLRPARRAIHSAGMNDATIDTMTIVQSKDVSRTRYMWTMSSGGVLFPRPRVETRESTAAPPPPTPCTPQPTP